MANYRITSPSGKSLVISGDTPPNEAELTDIFAKYDNPEINSSPNSQIPQRTNTLRPPRNMWDNVAETLVTNPAARGVGMALQGMSNSLVGDLARGAAKVVDATSPIGRIFPMSHLLDVDTKPLQSQNMTERAIETGSQFAGDTAVMAAGGNALKGMGLLGEGVKLPSRLARGALTGDVGTAAITGLGGGIFTGASNPESFGGQLLTTTLGAGAAGGVKAVASKALNPLHVTLGARNLEKQLTNGANGVFKDINFGRIPKQYVDDANAIRQMKNIAKLEDGKISIPGGVVKHLYERRILNNEMKPKEVSDMLVNSLHKKNNLVQEGSYPFIQAVVDFENKPANVGYIGKHSTTGQTIVKGGHKKSLKRLGINDDSLGGGTPLSQAFKNAPAAGEPALQGVDINVSDFNPFVNKNLVEALANKDKVRVLKNAAMAGNDDVLQEARILTDRIFALKNGAPDSALADTILTPKMRAAKIEYNTFMKNNADLPIDENIVRSFYSENPTAVATLSRAKRANPQGWKNIKEGSLAEFEKLKQLLKTDSKRVGEKASKIDAYETARQQLKNIVESYVSGFKGMNARYANAKLSQQMYEDAIKRGASTVGGTTKSPFISKIGSAVSGGILTGGLMLGSPATVGALAAGLGGRALYQAAQRAQGRAIMNGSSLNAEILRNTLNGSNNIFQNIKYPVSSEFLRKDHKRMY